MAKPATHLPPFFHRIPLERSFRRREFSKLLQSFIQETDVLDDDGKPTGNKMIIFPRYHQYGLCTECYYPRSIKTVPVINI